MIYQNVELYNIESVQKTEGREGVLLSRMPEGLEGRLRKDMQIVYRNMAGAEIRFCCDWKPARVTLACSGGEGSALLYYGSYQAQIYRITDRPTVIEIPVPQFLPSLEPGESVFSSSVRRLILSGDNLYFIGAEGEGIRSPKRDETPRLRYLAYGTSITQGLRATSPTLSYVSQTARRLGADALNFGASGNAFCEPALADWLAQVDWDFATLCISVNMLNQGVTAGEFKEKARYMAHTMATQNPDKPVVCIGLFPYYFEKGMRLSDRTYRSTAEEYRQTLEQVVRQENLLNLHYVDGRNLLMHFDGLSEDLIHPGDAGMTEIAENLAAFLKPLISDGNNSAV